MAIFAATNNSSGRISKNISLAPHGVRLCIRSEDLLCTPRFADSEKQCLAECS